MKIISRKAFLALPPGVLYAEYERGGYVSGLAGIKDETQGDDFYLRELSPWPVNANDEKECFAILERALDSGESVELDYDSRTNAAAFGEVEFAIWEPKDVRALIERLKQTLPAEEPDAEAMATIEAARKIYAREGDHEIRIDDDAEFSEADDATWVTAWVRVPD